MPQIKTISRRDPDYFIMILDDGTLCTDTIDNSVKFMNENTYGDCSAFVTYLPENATCNSREAKSIKMLEDGRCLVYIQEMSDYEKEAIETICGQYESELVFAPYGCGLGKFAKFLTDCRGLKPCDCDYTVVECDNGKQVIFIETEDTETFHGW